MGLGKKMGYAAGAVGLGLICAFGNYHGKKFDLPEEPPNEPITVQYQKPGFKLGPLETGSSYNMLIIPDTLQPSEGGVKKAYWNEKTSQPSIYDTSVPMTGIEQICYEEAQKKFTGDKTPYNVTPGQQMFQAYKLQKEQAKNSYKK